MALFYIFQAVFYLTLTFEKKELPEMTVPDSQDGWADIICDAWSTPEIIPAESGKPGSRNASLSTSAMSADLPSELQWEHIDSRFRENTSRKGT